VEVNVGEKSLMPNPAFRQASLSKIPNPWILRAPHVELLRFGRVDVDVAGPNILD